MDINDDTSDILRDKETMKNSEDGSNLFPSSRMDP